MTTAQAAGVTNLDVIAFSNASVTASNVVVVATGTELTVTAGGITRVFPPTALAATDAPTTLLERFSFSDQSSLIVGTVNNDTGASFGTANGDLIYGFDGNDTINAGAGHDNVYGGLGSDRLRGEDGNDHLYGNALSTTQGGADGDDNIDGGAGSDYIQGNAGNDTLAGGIGSDRVYGGQGNDVATGGDGNDTLQGNLGNDTLSGEGDDDSIRGGQGEDSLSGGGGNDQLFGDLGNDTISGGRGGDALTGGAGNDVFVFAAGDSPNAGDILDAILDYTGGSDKISLSVDSIVKVITDTAVTTTLTAARASAQALLDASTTDNNREVVAGQIGNDTYLFYSSTAGTGEIDAVVKLAGVAHTTITTADFIVV